VTWGEVDKLLPPPSGKFISAHFHVIIAASALMSSSVTLLW